VKELDDISQEIAQLQR